MKIKKILLSAVCIVLSTSLFFSLFKLYEIHKSLSINHRVVYYSRDDIPNEYKWDTSVIYSSDDEIKNDVNYANALLSQCMTDLRDMGVTNTNKVLDEYFALEQCSIKLNNYLQLYKLVGEDDVVVCKNEIATLYQKVSSLYSFICSVITSYTSEEVDIISKSSSKYDKFVEYIRKHKDEVYGDANLNNTINQLKQNYNSLTSSIEFPKIKYSDGSKLNLNYSTFMLCMQNKDRRLRRDVYETYYQIYQANSEMLAENLLDYMYFCDLYSETKGFDSTLDFCLWRTGVNKKVFDLSIRAVEEKIDLFSRYNQCRSKMLSEDNLEMYDVYVSPYKDSNKYIPYEEAKEIVIGALTPLGEEYINIVKRMFDEHWIDVYSSRGKEENSLQIDFYDVHPYIIINYQGTESDLYTLIHEIGHAVQSYLLSQEYAYWEFGVPEFLIEIASTLNEVLLSEYLLCNSIDEEEYHKNAFSYLEKIKINVFKQAQITKFELEIYNNKKIDKMSINDVYKKINESFYKNDVNSDPLISYEWCRLSSLYMNYYAYQYITSFAAAMQICDSLSYNKDCLVIGKYDDPILFMKQYDIDFQNKEMYEALFDKMEQLLFIVEN